MSVLQVLLDSKKNCTDESYPNPLRRFVSLGKTFGEIDESRSRIYIFVSGRSQRIVNL